jgi:hypothetical protein
MDLDSSDGKAPDIIKNNDVVRGIFSSSYYADSIDGKHEEFF